MKVSEHLQRELIYGLNATLLHLGRRFDAEAFATALLDILDREGARHHEPDLVARWAEAVELDRESLFESLSEAIDIVRDELDDEEVAWSAHRVLDLLAEETFWELEFDLPGEPLPVAPTTVEGMALPLTLRTPLVRVLDALELELFEAHQNQRSIHDALPERIFNRAMNTAMAALEQLATRRSTQLLRPSHSLPSLRQALERIQRWKLAVGFDASPDEDDGEWTLRVLERLYRIEWVAPLR